MEYFTVFFVTNLTETFYRTSWYSF